MKKIILLNLLWFVGILFNLLQAQSFTENFDASATVPLGYTPANASSVLAIDSDPEGGNTLKITGNGGGGAGQVVFTFPDTVDLLANPLVRFKISTDVYTNQLYVFITDDDGSSTDKTRYTAILHPNREDDLWVDFSGRTGSYSGYNDPIDGKTVDLTKIVKLTIRWNRQGNLLGNMWIDDMEIGVPAQKKVYTTYSEDFDDTTKLYYLSGTTEITPSRVPYNGGYKIQFHEQTNSKYDEVKAFLIDNRDITDYPYFSIDMWDSLPGYTRGMNLFLYDDDGTSIELYNSDIADNDTTYFFDLSAKIAGKPAFDAGLVQRFSFRPDFIGSGDTSFFFMDNIKLGLAAVPDTMRVRRDADSLLVGYDGGEYEGTIADVITNLDALASVGKEFGSDITWSSNTPANLANDGTVTRPGAAEADVVVELTATITLNAAVITKVFTITVLKEDDVAAPSAPANLASGNLTETSVDLTWDASTDNVAVDYYVVYDGMDSINTSATNSITLSGLVIGTTYSLTVTARDAAGNESTASNSVDVTPIDLTDPAKVDGLEISDSSETALYLSWNPASDNVGVVSYEVFETAGSLGTVTDTVMNITGLIVATEYSFTVVASDAQGNTSEVSDALVFTTPDLTAPTAPANLASSNVTMSAMDLTWDVSTDAVGVVGYIIYDGTDSLTTSATNSVTLTGLASATAFALTVKAYDAAMNLSAASNQVDETTLDDTDAPTVPAGLEATNIAMTGFTLHWDKSTDNVGVTEYEVFQGGSSIGTTADTMMAVSGLTVVTTYTYTVTAADAKGNTSAASTGLDVTTIDTEAPAKVTGVAAKDIAEDTLVLIWNKATDNVAVTEYEIFQDGSSIGTTADTSISVTGLTVNTTYEFTVEASDAAGNTSATSDEASVTTVDVTAPAAPANVTESALTQTSFTISWDATTDNVGVTGYEVFVDGSSVGTTTTETTLDITGLTASTTYVVTVKASDAVGNVSAASADLSVTTSDIPDAIDVTSISVNAYPNPATQFVNISVTGISEADVMVYDMQGKLLMVENNFDLTSSLNISQLTVGTYLLKVNTEAESFSITILKD